MMEPSELSLDELLERIGRLSEELEAMEPAVRDRVLELLDHLTAWHREAIVRLATAVPPHALQVARADPVVAHLLDTYLGEEEGDPAAVVEEALEEIRPYVHSHGGEIELVDVDQGVVTLRLIGACEGCPSSSATLTEGIERTLRERWAGFRALRVEGDGGHGAGDGRRPLISVESLKRK